MCVHKPTLRVCVSLSARTIMVPVQSREQTLTPGHPYIYCPMSVFNWTSSSKAPFCFLCYFDTFSAMRANAAAIPKANFLIIQLAALTGIQRWGWGGLKLEGSGKKAWCGFVWHSIQKDEDDELEKAERLGFPPYSSGIPEFSWSLNLEVNAVSFSPSSIV